MNLDCSYTVTDLKPACLRATAALSPPIPAPTMAMRSSGSLAWRVSYSYVRLFVRAQTCNSRTGEGLEEEDIVGVAGEVAWGEDPDGSESSFW
jgi:hypothetical protein